MRTWLTASSWQSIKNRANNPEKFNEKMKCFCSTCCSKNPRIKLSKTVLSIHFWANYSSVYRVQYDRPSFKRYHQQGVWPQNKRCRKPWKGISPSETFSLDAMKCYFQALTGNICCKKIVNLPRPEISHVKLRATYIHTVSQWF